MDFDGSEVAFEELGTGEELEPVLEFWEDQPDSNLNCVQLKAAQYPAEDEHNGAKNTDWYFYLTSGSRFNALPCKKLLKRSHLAHSRSPNQTPRQNR